MVMSVALPHGGNAASLRAALVAAADQGRVVGALLDVRCTIEGGVAVASVAHGAGEVRPPRVVSG